MADDPIPTPPPPEPGPLARLLARLAELVVADLTAAPPDPDSDPDPEAPRD